MYAEERLKAEVLNEAITKSGATISAEEDGSKRQGTVRHESSISISETCYRYQAKLSEENELIAD